MKTVEKINRVAQPGPLRILPMRQPMAKPNDERIFVIAPIGGDASAIAKLLTEHGFQASVCEDPATCMAEITSAGALVMTEEALEFPTTTNLMSVLEDQPTWSELPVI